MEIKVSVIIPVYNVASYLDACLSSCINQTFQEMEIIVVDDGSTDESPVIIQKYVEKDDRIKVITKQNEGLIYARKSGLDIAHGDFIFHLDGDDYIEANTIEVLYNEAINSESDYVVGCYYTVCSQNKNEVKINNKLNGLSGQKLLLTMLHKGWHIWGILIDKSLFVNLVYYPVCMGEDLFFNMQIAPKVRKAVSVDMCLYNHINRSDSITKAKESKEYFMNNFVMLRSIFYLLDIYPYNKQICERIYLMFFPFYLHGMIRKDLNVKTFLYDYYWSKKDVKSFLWKTRKDLYLITDTFFRFPLMASFMAKIYLQLLSLWRKYR